MLAYRDLPVVDFVLDVGFICNHGVCFINSCLGEAVFYIYSRKFPFGTNTELDIE